MSFAALERDPVGCIGNIYRRFGWDNFEAIVPQLEAYTASLAGFRKNQHTPLPAGAPQLVYRRWNQFFTEFGYPEPALVS